MDNTQRRSVHVVGGGLAGLSASVALCQAGCAVTVLEAGPAAGGRCRSYFDRELGLRIDNGNHLLLSGNRAAFAYLDAVGARHTLALPDQPSFPFIDLGDDLRWVLRPSAGRIPWWIFSRRRRVPGTGMRDYLPLQTLTRLTDDTTVAAALHHDPLYRRLIEPLAIAALNTPPDAGLARLLGAVVRETLLRGGRACIPALPREGLSESLVDPAIAWLQARGASVHYASRVTALDVSDGRVAALQTSEGRIPAEAVVLAVPPWVAGDLLPGLVAPDEFQAILNVHFRVEAPADAPGFVGIIGGTAEWVFAKRDHVSVTISAANRLVDRSAEAIAAAVWPDVQRALGLTGPLPPSRVVKERRATFAATAAQERRRPRARTGLANLVLAGDWTATGLPATIEGAIRSGRTAAETLLAA
nr:hydroxysqualene dehydroxylase [uncultured bacterium]